MRERCLAARRREGLCALSVNPIIYALMRPMGKWIGGGTSQWKMGQFHGALPARLAKSAWTPGRTLTPNPLAVQEHVKNAVGGVNNQRPVAENDSSAPAILGQRR